MKDYIRQEIFNVTENLVSLCQKNHALHKIRFDILMPDFLWESGFFENLFLDERKKYISFQCSSFDMDKYLQSSTCYDEQLPFSPCHADPISGIPPTIGGRQSCLCSFG